MQNDKVKFKIDEKILVLIISTAIGFSPALYLIRFSILGMPTTVLEIAIYLLFTTYFLLVTAGRARFSWPDRRWLWPIGLFVLAALIGVVISPDKRVALGQFKGFIVDPLLLALIIFNFQSANWRTILKIKILNYLIIAGVWLSIWAIGQKLIGQTVDGGRVLSIYQYDLNPSPNFLALYIAPLAATATILGIFNFQFSIFNKFSSLKFQIFNIISGILMIVAIILSGSRGGLLGTTIGILIGLIILQKLKWLKIGLTFLTFLTFLTTSWLARPDLSASPNSGRIASSNNIRWEIWTTTTGILTENPRNFIFGIGLGNYQSYFTGLTKNRVNYPEFIAPKALTPHNIFLAMWVNGGLLMLVAFIWILVIYFKTLLNLKVKNPHGESHMLNPPAGGAGQIRNPHTQLPKQKQFGLPLIAAMTALLVHGLVDTPYFKNDLSVEFWLLMTLALSLTIWEKRSGIKPSRKN